MMGKIDLVALVCSLGIESKSLGFLTPMLGLVMLLKSVANEGINVIFDKDIPSFGKYYPETSMKSI